LSYLFDIILHQIAARELVRTQRARDLNAGGPLENPNDPHNWPSSVRYTPSGERRLTSRVARE
jgi:hypothetical protein